MQIQSIQPFSVNQPSRTKKNTFKSWEREVYRYAKHDFTQELKHRNDTSFVRDGNYWKHLIFYLLYKYNKIPKVNVYDYACSDGSEAYTFLMSLISDFSMENAQKFLPIKAIDYDSVAIEKANSNKYFLKPYELNSINNLTNNQTDKFFDFNKENGKTFASPKKILSSNIEFKVANILHDYKNINPQNSIVFARNFWPYLREDALTLAKKLGKQLGENSTLILGKFDLYACVLSGINIVDYLYQNGFKESSVELVFDKIS